VPAGALAFTYCGAPVVYEAIDGTPSIDARWMDGRSTTHEGNALDPATSRALLGRVGTLGRLHVRFPRGWLLRI
jgi:hypothetical protein